MNRLRGVKMAFNNPISIIKFESGGYDRWKFQFRPNGLCPIVSGSPAQIGGKQKIIKRSGTLRLDGNQILRFTLPKDQYLEDCHKLLTNSGTSIPYLFGDVLLEQVILDLYTRPFGIIPPTPYFARLLPFHFPFSFVLSLFSFFSVPIFRL
jgi:hypothetical protein